MRRHMQLLAIVCTWICHCVIALPAYAATPSFVLVQRNDRGAVSVNPDNFKENQGIVIRLSDRLTLTLEVYGKGRLEVMPIDAAWSTEGWRTVEIDKPHEFRSDRGQSNVTIRQTLVLDPLKSGEINLVPPEVRYRDYSQGNHWQTIKWQPIPVHVTTEILQADISELRDVRPPEEIPPEHTWVSWRSWAAMTLGTATLGALVLVLMRLRRQRPEKLPPDQWALRELARISQYSELSVNQTERLGTLISDLFRRYLDMRFQMGISSRTTSEFLSNLPEDCPLSIEQGDRIRELLQRCDLTKFARQQLSSVEAQQLIDLARSLIEETAHVPSQTVL